MNNLPLPRWAHVPAEGYEANADYEALAQVKLLVPAAFRGYVPARHPHFGGAGRSVTVIQLHGEGPFQLFLGSPK